MELTEQALLNFSTYRNIALSTFFVAFGSIFLILFFTYKIKRENLFFSFFCFSICALFCASEFLAAPAFLFLILILAVEFISLLLSKILLEKNRSLLPISIVGILILISSLININKADATNFMQISNVYFDLLLLLFLFSVVSTCITIYKGFHRKKKDVILIIVAGLISFTLLILSFAVNAFELKTILFIISATLFPLIFSQLLGKRILNHHTILKQQLIEVENNQLIKIENLAIENLKKEKEKQVILENQNKVLEENVIARTLELVNEKQIVEEKNREILDSILYAKRIQATILPPLAKMKECFNESFVVYLPKDIVAGDFYWMETLKNTNTVFLAACDCTGHGVPGAFVSVICNNALNKTVREFGIKKPSEILDKVSEIVSFDLSLNNEADDEIMDGMDISFCSLDLKTGYLQWAGANNPFWLIKNSGDLIEIKADKQPIGKSHNRKAFTNHEMQVEKGDTIYLISDGYADQFSGVAEIKFQRSRFKEILVKNRHLSLEKQGELLNTTITEWRGENEQTDDICVLGIRI